MDNVFFLLLKTLATFILVAFVFITVFIGRVHRKFRHLPGPPCPSFYFGHISLIRAYHKRNQSVGFYFLDLANEYGPVFKVHIFHKCLVVVTGVPLIKEILLKSKCPKTSSTYKKLHSLFGTRFMGDGVICETDHEKWYKRRSAINPSFHKKYLRLFMDQFNQVGDKWIARLNSLADGQTMFSMHKYLCQVTLDAISEIGFNHELDPNNSHDKNFLVHLLNVITGLAMTIKNPASNFLPGTREFRRSVAKSVKFLRDHGMQLLTERVKQMKAGEQVPEDILTYILKCTEAVPELTYEDLIDDFMVFFVAGQETTSNALAFLFCEVGRRPEIVEKIQEEIDRVLGGKSNIEYDDLAKLEYVGQVFKETLRLYPVAPGTTREMQEEVTIDGYRLPKDSQLVFPFIAIHRLPQYYKEPDEFKPERFDSSEKRELFAYMPFSLGHRSCAGKQFATMESKVLICKFFQRFNFTLDPNQSSAIRENATLKPKDGAMMTLSPRN